LIGPFCHSSSHYKEPLSKNEHEKAEEKADRS
jgi:hypothetical protein